MCRAFNEFMATIARQEVGMTGVYIDCHWLGTSGLWGTMGACELRQFQVRRFHQKTHK